MERVDSAALDRPVEQPQSRRCADCIKRTTIALCQPDAATRGPSYLFEESGGFVGGTRLRLVAWVPYQGGKVAQFSSLMMGSPFLDSARAIGATIKFVKSGQPDSLEWLHP